MSEVQRQALARSLAARVHCLGLDEIRVIEHVVARLELGRERYGELDLAAPRDWGRELGEELVDALVYHAARELAAQDLAREGLREAARLEMLGGPRFHRVEVTAEQLAAAQRDPKLLAEVEQANDRAIAQVAARPPEFIAEFAPDQHLTRVSTEPARIAAQDVEAQREPYEDVETEWGGESG